MQVNSPKIATKDIVAYFDFDGTLTTCDTLVYFVLYVLGFTKFLLKLPFVIPTLVLYLFKIIDNETTKQRFLVRMIGGISQQKIETKAHNFAYHKLDKFIKPEIYAKLEYHLEHKHSVILVSANLAVYLREWALRHNLTYVIATELEVVNGRYSGKLSTSNCYGAHKLDRILEYLRLHKTSFVYSYGYGNSRGDYELLDYVNEGYWVNSYEVETWSEYSGRA
jgi:HAD superfamily hydrolase (TIGR01490 family)